MKLTIARTPHKSGIAMMKDFDDCESRGEIAHFIAELETARCELLVKWNEWEVKR